MPGDYEKIELHLTAEEMLAYAKDDIAALLWLNGNCQFCRFGVKEKYRGASRWRCSREKGAADCRPKWRYDNT